jgi:hypothetical protein
MALVTALLALPANGVSPTGTLTNTTGMIRLSVSATVPGSWQLIKQNSDSGDWFYTDAQLRLGDDGVLVGELKHADAESNALYHVVQTRPDNAVLSTASVYLSAESVISQSVGAVSTTTLSASGAATFGSTAAFSGVATFSAAPVFAAGLTASGAVANNWSGSTGNFSTSTGAFSAALAVNKNFAVSTSGTGTIVLDNASTWSMGATTGTTGTLGRSGQTLSLPGVVDATGVLSPPTVADAAVQGGVPIVFRHTLTSGANGDQDIVVTPKVRVIDAWLVMKGAGTAGCLVTVKNGATAITAALDVAASLDKAIVRFASIDDAQQEIAAGGTLRVSKASTGGDFPGAELYVQALHVA